MCEVHVSDIASTLHTHSWALRDSLQSALMKQNKAREKNREGVDEVVITRYVNPFLSDTRDKNGSELSPLLS